MRYKPSYWLYNQNVIGQSACLIINPIMADGFAALFNCTSVDRASYSKRRHVYGDLVYKFKMIRGMTDFSDQFGKNTHVI